MADRGQAPLDEAIEAMIVFEAQETLKLTPKGVVQLSDLIQWGRMGALDARERFDPRHRVHFKAFARHRVRGAMYDGVRSMGVLTRRTYDRLKQAAVDERLVGAPAPDPAGGPTRENDARVALQAIMELATCRIVALAEVQESAERTYEDLDAIEKIRGALESLSDTDQQVVRAVYDLDDEGDSGSRLAERLGTSRSTISRQHQAALARLRRLLQVA